MDGTRKFATALSLAGGATKAKIRKLKGRRWKYPLSLELQYGTAINRYMTKRWKEYAGQALAMMVPRMDSAVSLEPAPGEYGPALGAIVSIARNIGEFNKREMDAFRKIAVGDAFVQDEPWVEKTLQDWAQNQVSLITKATDDMRDAVARRVRDGVKHGKINREIESQIMQDLPGISKRRAQIIARDQASKLNASLSEGRMKDAGLETYIWETAYDERVRGLPGGKYPKALPSHWAMQGKICRWDDPTVYRNAKGEWEKRPANCPYTTPGTEILCRCVALPNWDELEEVEAAGPEVKAQREIERAQEAIEKAATAAGYINPSNPALAAFVQEEARAKTALENLLAAVTGAAKKPAAVVVAAKPKKEEKAPPTLENLEATIKKADKNWKHWNADERARYAEKLVELFENSDFGMNVPRTNDRGDDVIAAIFGSHFKNQMETKTGEGLVDVAYRKKASETLFGTKLAKTKDAEFEKYGFLMDKDMFKQATSGIADQYWRYGDGVQVRFKKDMVKTTFTIGDSLGAGLTPSYTSDPKVVSSRNAHINRVLALTETKSAAEATRSLGTSYIELQYHGNLTPDMVESVFIPAPTANKLSAEAIQKMRDSGAALYTHDAKGNVIPF